MKIKHKVLPNNNGVKSANKSYEAFKKRFSTVMGDQFDLTDDQLRQIYDGISSCVETSIYAEMEDVLSAIRNTYHADINWVIEETVKLSKKHQNQSNKYTNDGTLRSHKSFSNLNKEEYQSKHGSFKQFITHVVTNYQSLPKQRIDVLVIKHEGYQHLELTLFGESFIQQHGFRTAHHLHNELMHAFYTAFDDLLAKGTVLKSDQAIQEQVLAPVLKRFDAKLAAKVGDSYEQVESL
ncbi:hypothetical protein SAMN05216238_1138 [Lentibacillus persicus]|uniref:Uncharacterized protein n=1 Tax=Lentibacillus persicus TaxID=640948 RepID=A0A1I1ZNQ9_9BACI|nr:hypothetical protein [Lentibacillus persicus]SFE33285.1 hypothetical protein SAMN05216238_1138 [Lentibacillus persicus]